MTDIVLRPGGADYSFNEEQYEALRRELEAAGLSVEIEPEDEYRSVDFAAVWTVVQVLATVADVAQLAASVREHLRGPRMGTRQPRIVRIVDGRGEVLREVEVVDED
jgi:hypothetical protein